MADVLTYNDRLPGVLCETGAPARSANPLRLDVAAFVGFAERGPVDVPVLIEDFSQYRLIFGGDLPLAFADGRPVYAHLPRTVETFFENGGQRCYVVRVAGTGARPNTFTVPGLLSAGGWQPIAVPAAWPGRWSDLVSIGTTLRVTPLKIRSNDSVLQLDGAALTAGDFTLPLRTSSANSVRPGDLLRVHVESGSTRHHVYVRAAAIAQESTLAIQPATVPVTVQPDPAAVHVFDTAAPVFALQSIDYLTAQGWTTLPFAAPDITWEQTGENYRLTLPITSDFSETVTLEQGALLRLTGAAAEPPLFITVQDIVRGRTPGDPSQVSLIIDTDSTLHHLPALPPGTYDVVQVDLLSFDLIIREGEDVQEVWPDLRFSAGEAHWQNLLMPALDSVTPFAFTVDDFRPFSLRLGLPATSLDTVILPVGMQSVPAYYGPIPDPAPGGKDGLDVFDPPTLFLDDDFVNVGRRTINATANDLLYLSASPRRLTGIHSLIPLDEVSLVTIPDLVHVGWEVVDDPLFDEYEPPEPAEEQPDGFHDCPPEVPVIPPEEEAMPVLMLDLESITSGSALSALLAGLPAQFAPELHDLEPMLDVQRALIRMCAANADRIAVLSVPQHYTGRVIDQWREKLVTTPEFYDGDPLSYAAVFHGWAGIREVTTPMIAPLRYIPPDGVICGMIASREIQRGVWIAPANMALHSVADLDPDISEDGWARLYNQQINIIRWRPGRYTTMSAMTLAHDRTLIQISVRRLLIFLRKVALREGQRYVFETNNTRFRALVQTYFEHVLAEIQDRGGLQAFQVVTGDEINTPNDSDNGRFLIALKVAPTLPIEFITIIMLRSGDNGIDIFER